MRGKPIPFLDFSKGINRRDAPYLLGDGEARDALNVISTARGAIRKRDGAIGFATPANALTSLFAAQSPTFLIGAGSTKLFSISPAGTATDITGALVLTSDALFEFVQAPASGGQGPIYGVNGNQAVQWTGTGNATAWTASAGTLPIGKYLEYAGNRVWAAGMSSYAGLADPGSYVAFSELGDPRNWPAANRVGFDPNDGEAISGIGRAGDYLLVFKPSKLWAIYDLDTGANRAVTENIGCVAHRSIAETDKGLYFLSRDQGVYVTRGGDPERLSDKLQPVFETLVQANRHLAAGTYFNGHYYLSISDTGSANSLLLDFDQRNESWWLHGQPAAQLVVWEPSGEAQLFGAVPGVARVDRLFVPDRTQDAGDANFAAYWRGPHHVFGAPQQRKRVRGLHFDGKGRIEVSVARDFASSPTLEGSADFASAEGSWEVDDGSLWEADDGGIYGGTSEVGEQRLSSLGVARAWSVQFGNATADDFEVESYTFGIQSRER